MSESTCANDDGDGGGCRKSPASKETPKRDPEVGFESRDSISKRTFVNQRNLRAWLASRFLFIWFQEVKEEKEKEEKEEEKEEEENDATKNFLFYLCSSSNH